MMVLCGLSGGIDSSAAALLARERWPGLEFRALYQDLGWDDPAAEDDAHRVAEAVGAPLTVQRSDVGRVWTARRFLPMAGMPCPASRELKTEPALLWAAEMLGGRARWEGGDSRHTENRGLVFEADPAEDGAYVLGFLAGEEARAARYRAGWPEELGRPVFPLLEAGRNKDDARAILRRHGIHIDYRGLPRRSCQPCIHWGAAELEVLVHLRPEHAARVGVMEREIGRTFDRRGPLDTLPGREPNAREQASFPFVDGTCGAFCR